MSFDRLNIELEKLPRPRPEVVTLRRVRRVARDAGYANAGTLDIAGITLPRIEVNQRGLNYQTRRTRDGMEFRFDRGVLKITGWQNIYMSNHMRRCERRVWVRHEMDHVRDNETIMDGLAAALCDDSYMQSIFRDRQWLPRDSFDLIQMSTQETCFRIFTERVAAAVRRRDTAAEYRHVRREVREACGGGRRRRGRADRTATE